LVSILLDFQENICGLSEQRAAVKDAVSLPCLRMLAMDGEKMRLVRVNALCFLQCFDSWLSDRKDIQHIKKSVPLISKGSLLEQVEEENLRENRLTLVHLENDH